MIVVIHGSHNSGKTTFIEKLLKKLSKYKIVVIKNSSLTALETPNSDSARYRKAGAMASILRTQHETILFISEKRLDYSLFLAQKINPDIILLEGFKDLPKLDCLMVDMDKKNNINDIYQEILKEIKKKHIIEIFAGGNRLPLNPFVQDLYYKTIKTMVSALHKGEHGDIEINLKN